MMNKKIIIKTQKQLDNLFEVKDASLPHKIAFKEGKVLYVCDKFGKEIT